MAKGKSIKTIIKELRAADPSIITAEFYNDKGEHWGAHVLYTQEFRLDSNMGKKWLAHTTWKRLEVVEKDNGHNKYKEIVVEI